MLEFNNNHIFTGYLKQLLSSFNLPTTKVYSMDQKRYFDKNNKEFNVIASRHRDTAKEFSESSNLLYLPYIKDNLFQEYIKVSDTEYKWVPLKIDPGYYYGKKNLHYTKNLIIKNNIYDSYTHEYLGNYLRFQRDYHDINLMPLYNCFSNKICSNLNLSFRVPQKPYTPENSEESTTADYRKVIFDSDDKQYKIYMLPIKLLQKYTIAIDCDTQVEFCCWFQGKYQKTLDISGEISDSEKFVADTYVCKKNLSFNQPFIFDALWTEPSSKDPSDPTYEAEMWAHKAKLEKLSKWANLETDLKLFIKLPVSNNSSITVLEGDYLNYNDRFFRAVLSATKEKLFIQKWETISNHFVTNYEEDEDHPAVETRDFRPITFLQLLSMNTGKSYPFADRLIEYLLGNVITEYDKLEDNVARVQAVMELNGFYTDKKGLWEKRIRPIMYDYINDTTVTQNSRINHDIFGYIDKDVEKYYKGNKWTKDGYQKVTISNIDLYTELYTGGK